MAALCAKSSVASAKLAKSSVQRSASRAPLAVRASQRDNVESADVNRRTALGLLAGAAALVARAPASQAAYGEAANVFGKVTNTSGFTPYAGEGFTVALPAKWNPSKERDFPNVVLRYEDNFDAVNNLIVITEKTDKSSIDQLGAPDKFLESISYLFGKQAFAGQTKSEGGFAPNRVSAASLLGVEEVTDKKGKKYYQYDILTRTADGDEGGRHQIIKAGVGNGNLYILKVQAGDKRWFKGVDKEVKGAVGAFTIA